MLQRIAQIVLAAGAELSRLRGAADTQGHWEGTQLKTAADLLLDRFLRTQLEKATPDMPIISEEDAGARAVNRPARYWLIDPIDGTASFSAGFPGYVTQIALMEGTTPRLAAICAPALELLYLAEKGRGATLNGRPLLVAPGSARRILIDNSPEPRGVARSIHQGLLCDGYIECGSISLKVCRVADGTADLFVKDVVVRDWDVAPADLVLGESGGYLCLPDRNRFLYHGSLEKPGLVAAHSMDLVHAAIDCMRHVQPNPT